MQEALSKIQAVYDKIQTLYAKEKRPIHEHRIIEIIRDREIPTKQICPLLEEMVRARMLIMVRSHSDSLWATRYRPKLINNATALPPLP